MSSGGTANDIIYSITATSTDVTQGSGLKTTTIDTSNTRGSQTETIQLVVTGSGYTMAGIAKSSLGISASYSVSGTAGPPYASTDTTTVSSTVAETSLGSSTGTVSGSAFGTTGYTFTPGPPRLFSLSFLGFSIITKYFIYILYLLAMTKATTNLVKTREDVPQKLRFFPNAGFAIRSNPPILMRWP